MSANPTQPITNVMFVNVLDSGIGKTSAIVVDFPLLKCRALRDDTPNAMIARNGNVVVMTA